MSSIVGGRTNGCQGPIELTCASWERRQRVIIKLSNGYEDELCGLVEARCVGFYYFRHLDFCLKITHDLQFDAGHFFLDIFCLCFACFPRWLDVNAPLWHCGCHRARHPGPWQFHFRLRGCTAPLCPRSRSSCKWDRWRSVKWSRGICNQCVGLWGKSIESRGYGFWWDVASKCLQNYLHHFGTKLF